MEVNWVLGALLFEVLGRDMADVRSAIEGPVGTSGVMAARRIDWRKELIVRGLLGAGLLGLVAVAVVVMPHAKGRAALSRLKGWAEAARTRFKIMPLPFLRQAAPVAAAGGAGGQHRALVAQPSITAVLLADSVAPLRPTTVALSRVGAAGAGSGGGRGGGATGAVQQHHGGGSRRGSSEMSRTSSMPDLARASSPGNAPPPRARGS